MSLINIMVLPCSINANVRWGLRQASFESRAWFCHRELRKRCQNPSSCETSCESVTRCGLHNRIRALDETYVLCNAIYPPQSLRKSYIPQKPPRWWGFENFGKIPKIAHNITWCNIKRNAWEEKKYNKTITLFF